jgi:hypothetical protein
VVCVCVIGRKGRLRGDVRKTEGNVSESKSGGEGRSDCMVDQYVKEGLW